MTNLTSEQIQAILDGAPEGATHVDRDGEGYIQVTDTIDFDYMKGVWRPAGYLEPEQKLSDLREILTLRQRVEELEREIQKPTDWPDKCPITRRELFMEIDGVPTYGGPFDSYTIPVMDGEIDQPWHERELVVKRYDHDEGGWLVDEVEVIPFRVIGEEALMDFEDKAGKLIEIERQQSVVAARAVESVKDWFVDMSENHNSATISEMCEWSAKQIAVYQVREQGNE